MSLSFGNPNILYSLDSEAKSDSTRLNDNFVVDYKIKQPKKKNLHIYKTDSHIVVLLGTIYEGDEISNPAKYVYSRYVSHGAHAVFEVDGCFLIVIYSKYEEEYVVFSERFGVIPIYYLVKNDKILFSTSIQLFLSELTYDDIDLTAVRDLLRHGSLIGEATFSERVKMLEGGSRLIFRNGMLSKQRLFLFHYDEENAEHNTSKLIGEVAESYFDAVRKRLEPVINDSCIFLSGGIDSRFLLATLNNLFSTRIPCVTIGQPYSEETTVARRTAALKGNPLHSIELSPVDFIKDSRAFVRLVGGSDFFSQSYTFGVGRQLGYSAFSTGFSLDALIGGTFLSEDGENARGGLISFFLNNEQVFKMTVFSEDEFDALCGGTGIRFPRDSGYLESTLKDYDDFKVKEAMQPFGIRTRALRLVLGRTSVFEPFMEEHFPSVDMKFLSAIAKIPAKQRLNHNFYREMFLKFFPEYCNIVYNNTTLPISAPLEEWKKGVDRELLREEVYAKLQITNQQSGDVEAPFYPHFYSDFVGYSRADANWKKMLSETLLSDNTFITQEWFDKGYVEKLLQDHFLGKQNNRSKIIALASLEIFLSHLKS